MDAIQIWPRKPMHTKRSNDRRISILKFHVNAPLKGDMGPELKKKNFFIDLD